MLVNSLARTFGSFRADLGHSLDIREFFYVTTPSEYVYLYAMSTLQLALYFFLGFTSLALLLLLFNRKLVQAAFLLFAVLLGVGATYVFLGAEFLAVSQLVVYVGGILVLMMFGIMLTQREQHAEATSPLQNIGAGIGLVGLLTVGLLYVWNEFRINPPIWMQKANMSYEQADNVQHIGTLSLSRYLFPFEFVSIILLLCLVGAALLARSKRPSQSS